MSYKLKMNFAEKNSNQVVVDFLILENKTIHYMLPMSIILKLKVV